MPRSDRLGRHPHRQAAAVAQRDLVLPPILHPVPGVRDLVTAGLVMLYGIGKSSAQALAAGHHPTPATYPCRTLAICAPTPRWRVLFFPSSHNQLGYPSKHTEHDKWKNKFSRNADCIGEHRQYAT